MGKDAHEAAIKAKEAEAEALTGKDKKYIDACKVVKGLEAPNGNFMTKAESAAAAAAAAPKEEAKEEKKAEKKDDKPKKKMEPAGLSPDEKKELDKLKNDIIARKAELKAAGKSGGECNKDEQVVGWVARMTELKIKEDPTLADADKKKGEEYRLQLKSEFQYSDKDIKADPDMQDMMKQLQKKELDKLKTDIIARKAELKAAGK